MNRRVAVVAALLSLLGTGARAWPVAFGFPTKAAATDDSSSDSKNRIEYLSMRYGVTPEEIGPLRRKGMGWGDIKHALFIAQRSGKPLAGIVALRESGLGWGQIAHRYGFQAGKGKTAAQPRRFEQVRRARTDAGTSRRVEGRSHRAGGRRR